MSWTVAAWLLLALQVALALRVMLRLARTARGSRIAPASKEAAAASVTVLVPVLDEERRLTPCLDALRAQSAGVREILVVDGGSKDATCDIVRDAARRDARTRLIVAAPVPNDWNGKAWNLATGLSATSPESRFVLALDADVIASPQLVDALVEHADVTDVRAFSVATQQRIPDAFSGVVHPSMLTTLVYRYGIPGSASTRLDGVQANGQCFFVERELLVRTGAIVQSRDSRCEDVTMARAIAASGTAVGFYESLGLVHAAMYENWRETLVNWPRSLPTLDRYSGAFGWIGLFTVLCVQALPPLVAPACLFFAGTQPVWRAIFNVQIALVIMRVATLLGTRRAYAEPPLTYWLSPLADLPVAVLLFASALRRNHVWRGRALVTMRSR